MVSVYTNHLRLEEIGTGEQSGDWGATTNTNLELIAEGFSYGTEAIGDADTTITMADGASDGARSLYLKITSSTNLTATRTITLAPNTVSKVWIIENATDGSQIITIKQGSGSGASVNIANGQVKMIATDGGGTGGIVYDLLTDVELAGTTTATALTVDDVAIDGKVITMTGSTGDTAVMTVGTNGTLTVTTTDTAAAAANITITADGTFEAAGTTVTLNSSGGITLDADGGTITFADGGASLGTITSSGYSGTAAVATTVTITDNESTNEDNAIIFTAGGDVDGGNIGLESDGTLTYNPSTGTVTATGFSGNLTGTLQTAAQANVTSLGTLTTLTVDNVVMDGAVIGHTSDTDLITLSSGVVTVAGELDAVTGDFSSGVDVAGTLTTAAITASGVVDVTNTTDASDATGDTGALRTEGGASIAKKLFVGTDLSVGGNLTIPDDGLFAATNTSGNILVADGTNFNSIAVSSLSEISTAANDDVLIAIDTSGGGLKKISRSTIIAGTGSSSDLANVVEDTSPQLGGDLDVVTHSIITDASNRDINFQTHGTGVVVIKGNTDNSGTNAGAIKLNCSANTHGQTLKAQPHSAGITNTMLLPIGSSSTLVSLVSTDTLQNKTFLDLATIKDTTDDANGAILQFVKDRGAAAADGDDVGTILFTGDNSAQEQTNFASIVAEVSESADTDEAGKLSFFVAESNGTSSQLTAGLILEGEHNQDGQVDVTIGAGSGSTTIIAGDLQVSGTTTTVNSTTVNLNDHNIVLDSGNSTSAVINGAGITIEGGSGDDATFTYNTTGPKFELKLGSSHEDLQVAGLIATTGVFSGILKSDDTTDATSTTDGSLQTDGGLSVAKDAVLGNDVKLLSDAAVLSFGANSEVTLTHVHNDGLLLNADNQLQFRDSAINIRSDADGDLDINADDEIELNSTLIDINGNTDISGTLTVGGVLKTDDTTEATSTTDGSLQTDGGLSVAKDCVFGDDVKLLSDASVLSFGADGDITVTHVADVGLNIKNTNTGDDKPIILTLQTGETDLAANEVIGAIRWQAPDEATGTDAILVSAAIQAVAEGDHSSSSNATKLEFHTGASEAAASKMALSSGGNLSLPTDADADDNTADSATGRLEVGASGDLTLYHNTNSYIVNKTGNLILHSETDDSDIVFTGEDGSSGITALTLDMSAAGAATFNDNVTAFSDRRLKSDIQTLENGLAKVEQLRGVTYIRNDNVDGGQQLGVIAQEVEEVFPQVVLTANDERGTKSVDYGRLTGALIEAVKELSAKVKELEARLD